MTGAASAAEWAACAGIGTGVGAVSLVLLKVWLDGSGHRAAATCRAEDRYLPVPAPAALPARAPQLRARHAAPPLVDETQPICCVHPRRARHAREAA
ncbi:hypothetical protein [Streptomyces sp. NPDC020489]|uniref:hypothetical protein n=1 Tax=Streptomyces sp. NPDC020489 TaxID=3365077 RepID=UPI0037A59126